MPWSLEIHHLDVKQGDATLIVARRDGAQPIVRTALIDGGRGDQADSVDAYMVGQNLPTLHVMVATHFDADHFKGLEGLLRRKTPDAFEPRYNRTIIFDQGWPGELSADTIPTWVRAINGLKVESNQSLVPNVATLRSRPTNRVRSDGQNVALLSAENVGPPASPVPVADGSDQVFVNGIIAEPASWLVGREILWTNAEGNPDPALYGGDGPAPGTAGGPPSIQCIAANMYVQQANGPPQLLQGGQPSLDALRNQKSLAFVIQFNNFRYYVGGDITSIQEDGFNGVPGIRQFLNPDSDPAQRVHAMKASHHGAAESTSQDFVDQLLPAACFISSGTDNPFGHPTQAVLTRLQNQPTVQNYYMTEDRDSVSWCQRLNAQEAPDLPGGVQAPPPYTAKAVVAGAWGPPQANWGDPPAEGCNEEWPNDGAPAEVRGDIVLTVTEAQSQGNVQFNVRYNHPPFGNPPRTQTTEPHQNLGP